MAGENGLRVVGYFDCPGGGQVTARNNVAYIGHVSPPHGTSLVDVGDPKSPRLLAEIKVPPGTLSHKVRVENDVMLVNREIYPIGRHDPDFRGGLEVFDVSNPASPRPIKTWSTRGMHRFTFDGRYVYGSPELDGYLGNIVSIIDFNDPARQPARAAPGRLVPAAAAGGRQARAEQRRLLRRSRPDLSDRLDAQPVYSPTDVARKHHSMENAHDPRRSQRPPAG